MSANISLPKAKFQRNGIFYEKKAEKNIFQVSNRTKIIANFNQLNFGFENASIESKIFFAGKKSTKNVPSF